MLLIYLVILVFVFSHLQKIPSILFSLVNLAIFSIKRALFTWYGKEETITFTTATSDILASEKYDFVFANILHNVLAAIMPDLKRIMKKGAKIVLSGILEGKEPVVLEAIKNNNLKMVEEMRQKEWIAFVVQKED